MILVLGCGSIGRRHSANLRALGQTPVAFDPDPSRLAWVGKELKCRTVASIREGLALKPRAVWVCTPPPAHRVAAEAALRARIPCFIEKPLAHSLADGAALARLSKRGRLAVGYNWRFHPALRQIKDWCAGGRWGRMLFLRAQAGQYLPDWRPWQDYRHSYTARRSMGGGVLLDASHELDLVRWLAGEAASVFCTAGRLSRLKIDVEDTAALTLKLRSGGLAEVHLDMVQRTYRRTLELSFQNATVLWDYSKGALELYDARRKRWTKTFFKGDANALYLAEARSFLVWAAGGRRTALPDAADALKTLRLVEAAKRSARSGRLERAG